MQSIDYSPYPLLVYKYDVHTIDALAYSMNAKMYQYYLHSTNHNRNYDQQNVTVRRPNSKMNEMLNRKSKAM